MIKVGDMVFETEENQQVVHNDIDDTEQVVVEIENACDDEPIVVNRIEDDELIRIKSNGRKYSKLRGHASKQTRARQPWVGARKAE